MASGGIDGFGLFRIQLASQLTSDEVLRLATAFGLNRAKIDQLKNQISPGLLFTEFIQEENIISPTSISRLTDALIEVNLRGVAEDVRRAWDSYRKKTWKSENQPALQVLWEPIHVIFKGKKNLSRSNSDISVLWTSPSLVSLSNSDISEQGIHYHQRNLGDVRNIRFPTDTPSSAEGNPFKDFLNRLCLPHKLSIKDILKLREYHLHIKIPVTPDNVVGVFLSRLMSHDYRALYAFTEPFKNAVKNAAPNEMKKNLKSQDWINAVKTNEFQKEELIQEDDEAGNEEGISCRDGVFATIVRSDPFLLQEILGKMTACQLAVPLLLPNPLTQEITMLLWGLRQIKKTWVEESGVVHEIQITEDYFPVVVFLRLGDIAVSKSTILNLLLGPLQGQDNHPIFFSSRQDIKEPEFSKGLLEAFWFQPNDGRKTKHSLLSATCFLNLRGDATEFEVQQNFACKFASFVVIFVNAANKYMYKQAINTISNTTDVILVALSENLSETSVIHASQKVTVCNISTRNDKLIAEILCNELANNLSKENVKLSRLGKEGVEFSSSIGIAVDMFSEACQHAKQKAMAILNGAKKSPKAYKASALKLQETWRKWTKVDKDTSWQANDGNIALHLNQRELEKRKHRRNQFTTRLSNPIERFYECLLQADDAEIQFLTIWLHILLNEISQTTLFNLNKNIQMLGKTCKNTTKKITAIYNEIEEERDKISEKDKKTKLELVKKLEAKEEQLQKDRIAAAHEFDESSVGFEHLVREVGQLYESHCELKKKDNAKYASHNVHILPEVAARLLLLGQPIEILDGDTSHVPLLWVKGLLHAVQSQIKFDAKLFIISVLGVQSSGKSTLLNSMFGVRFAVSAGRCTRGVYMQMLEVDNKLRKKLGYDFLVLVDTEGLRAPEKSIAGTPDLDNKLATFALCISNMTLINIGGQTVGDDLTDVLQVAAHAFIRMKEVQLQSSCRLVQQFVADLTARAKNENSTQSIKQKLDEAIKTAAKEEGMHRRYRQFTDVFNVLNDDDVRDLQYIPSLWRSSAAPPNHSYSEKVLELKTSLLDSKRNEDTRFVSISEFGKRIEDVWNAVKQEDFVFNFRNSIIMAQYKNFQKIYQMLKINIRKDTMSFELERIDQIVNATADSIDKVLSQAKLVLSCVISEKYDAAKTQIYKLFEDNNFSEVKKLYKDQFALDLQLYKEATVIQIKNKLDIIAQKSREKKITEDTHLPKFESELKQRVFSVARELHNSYSKQLKEGKTIPENEIRRHFDDVWNTFMMKMQSNYFSQSDVEVREQVNELLTRCLIDNADQTNFSKYLRDVVLHKDRYHSFSALSENVIYKEDVQKLVRIFENDCTTKIDSAYKTITDITKGKTPNSETCKFNDIISCEILQSLQTVFELLPKEIHVSDLHDIRWVSTCVAGFTISKLQENWKGHFGKFNSEFLADIRFIQRSENRETILSNIKSQLEQKLSRTILTSALRYTKAFLRIGVPHQQSQDNFETKIQNLLEQLKYDRKSYESGELISDFLDSAIEIIKSNEVMENCESVWSYVCSQLARSIHEQIESSKLDSTIIATKYPEYVEGCSKIKEMVLNGFRNVIDGENVRQMEEDLTPGTIEKLANLPPNMNLQSVIDINILSKLEKQQTDDYIQILTTMKRIKCNFLKDLPESGSIDESLISDLINNTQREFPKYLETDEVAYMILHMCAWAFPISAAFQVSYEKENNIVLQLEKMKEIYFKDFKNWCLDTANDTRQAEELHALMKPAILACVKNKICTTLFGFLAHEGEIFTSRQHLIRHMLRQLAEEEDFKGYLLYIKDHELFTKNWIKNYIVDICSKRTTKLNINNLASSEIKSTVDFTSLCFVESLLHVFGGSEILSLVNVLDIFCKKCKEKISIYVNENDFDTLKKFSSSIKEYHTYQKEFLNLLQDLPDQLMRDINIPKQNDVDGTARWLQRLPVPLDIELAKRVEGCKNQCPFCGSVCDETTATHNKHLAALHYPTGIKGIRNKRTKELVCDVCTSKVSTETRFYPNCNCDDVGCDCRWFFYREYEKEYPDWYIRPIPDNEPTAYWKWVMAKFNTDFSDYYKSEEARIPETWREITKSEALDSLDDIYH